METKIKEHYKSNFNSSPVDVSEEEIQLLIDNDCKCSYCHESIFELDDFPEILMKDSEVMCEECYDEHYREICPICEESYDIKDFTSDYFVLNEEGARETKKKPGIYKILDRPFYFGNCVTGFDGFFDGSIQLVAPIRINDFKKIECGDDCCEVGSETICPDCIEKFIRKSNYLKTDGRPCILLKQYENSDLFKGYTKEQIHQMRQKLIHQRITCRGIIETANKKQ